MIRKFFYRVYQKIMYLLAFLISFKEPKLIITDSSSKEITKILHNLTIKKVFIVSDAFLITTKHFKTITSSLKDSGIDVAVFSETKPNPSIELIEKSLLMYKSSNSEAIIAYGGGSPIDLAKVLGARVARPKKRIKKMRGTIKVLKKIPLLIAIPTTVGTGSEATLAAVVSDKKTNEKFAIMDSVLMPKYAILDIDSVINLPSSLVATTGMDALTHAIEAYIGKANTKKTKKMAEEAIVIIFKYLQKAYNHEEEALAKMQLAAYKAGVAFTRAYVGNVHALAHTLSGFYDYPHGLANAIILPYVLDFYGSAIEKKLSYLTDLIGIGSECSNINCKAQTFISKIREMQRNFGIQSNLNGLIKEKDIILMAERAYQEANPLYPVPVIMDKKDFLLLLKKIN